MSEDKNTVKKSSKTSEQGKQIGKNIREIRAEKNMTQKELAELVGVSPAMIWQYENGYRVPRGDAFIRLVIALDTSGNELIRGVSDFPVSLAMIDPLHYGDASVLEFAKSIGKDIPTAERDTNNNIMTMLIEDDCAPFSTIANPLGVYKVFLTAEEKDLLDIYKTLNVSGKAEAKKRLSELAQLKDYARSSDEPLTELESFIQELNSPFISDII